MLTGGPSYRPLENGRAQETHGPVIASQRIRLEDLCPTGLLRRLFVVETTGSSALLTAQMVIS